jgi:hypothetical protein
VQENQGLENSLFILEPVREKNDREAENQAGNEGGKPFQESIEHGDDDTTLEFAAKVSLEAPLASDPGLLKSVCRADRRRSSCCRMVL